MQTSSAATLADRPSMVVVRSFGRFGDALLDTDEHNTRIGIPTSKARTTAPRPPRPHARRGKAYYGSMAKPGSKERGKQEKTAHRTKSKHPEDTDTVAGYGTVDAVEEAAQSPHPTEPSAHPTGGNEEAGAGGPGEHRQLPPAAAAVSRPALRKAHRPKKQR